MAEPRASCSKYISDNEEQSEEETEMEVQDGNSDDTEMDIKPLSKSQPVRKKKRGIIYISSIPKYMNVIKVREIFSQYGEIGRVYLQLAEHELKPKTKKQKKRKKPAMHFTEGWVEFESKRVAKFVAERLNNTLISVSKKSKFCDITWNIKYLPRFKWIHLSERLAYERAVHKQRKITEIAQAKREASFFSFNVDRSEKLKKKKDKGEKSTSDTWEVTQRDTDMEIRKKKNEVTDNRTELVKKLFS
ncbi:activator of basal transcription 1-like [Belonocnema kinseyi]|uniref:activator of basal transcription 1-like n=1 Tax=Belonocnema kinseyi TaxID=2817044 RepID=UPI00143CEFD3|nr:activator of basal transcription 1-like [Belonocnema kinseyi]